MWPIILAFLLATVLPIVVSVMFGLGIGIVTYTGADFAITQAEGVLNGLFGTMSSSLFAMLDIIGLTAGVQILFAAMTAKITIQTTLGAFTKFKISGS